MVDKSVIVMMAVAMVIVAAVMWRVAHKSAAETEQYTLTEDDISRLQEEVNKRYVHGTNLLKKNADMEPTPIGYVPLYHDFEKSWNCMDPNGLYNSSPYPEKLSIPYKPGTDPSLITLRQN